MKKATITIVLTFSAILIFAQEGFLSEQKKYSRVRIALSEKEQMIISHLEDHSISLNGLNILFVAFKHEGELELFARDNPDSPYVKVATYPICAKSGDPGPKRKSGDYQVPEGFYYINRFNPASSYYLSLGINYPNGSDRIKSDPLYPGGDIFIHGACVTIGCLPMTDELIKEIYVYAIHARSNGQLKIPVYIFPFRMTEQKMTFFQKSFQSEKTLLNFWTNLKPGYDQFTGKKRELNIETGTTGDYIWD